MNQRTKLASALLAFALVFSLTAWSQESKPTESKPAAASVESNDQTPEHYFRLTFRVLNLSPEGKIVDSRSYIETIPTGREGLDASIMRTDDRLPLATSVGANTQFQYVEAGTHIEVQRAKILDRTLALKVTASISTFSSSNPYVPANMKKPIVRNIRWVSWVTIPINKPTIIFSSDNNANKGRTELELTAVPVNQ
jgi:hypothetical protein